MSRLDHLDKNKSYNLENCSTTSGNRSIKHANSLAVGEVGGVLGGLSRSSWVHHVLSTQHPQL